MKASQRRQLRRDIASRRCPDCRNRLLAILALDPLDVWCEDCGRHGAVVGDFPLQAHAVRR